MKISSLEKVKRKLKGKWRFSVHEIGSDLIEQKYRAIQRKNAGC